MMTRKRGFADLGIPLIIWLGISVFLAWADFSYISKADKAVRIGGDHLVLLVCMIAVSLCFGRFRRRKQLCPENFLIAAFWFYFFIGYLIRNSLYNDDYAGYSALLCVLGLFAALIGISAGRMAWADELFRHNSRNSPASGDGRYDRITRAYRNLKILLPVSVLISISAGLLWYRTLGTIPIFSSDVEHARIDLARGTFVLRQLMTLGVAPFWLAIAYGGTHRFGRVLIHGSFFIISFLLVSQGYRSFLLSFWLVSLLIQMRRPGVGVNFKTLAAIGSAILAFALLFGVYRYETSSTADVSRDAYLVAAGNFFARPEATDYIISEFPAARPYQLGNFYVMGLGFLIPGEQKSPGLWLKEDVFDLDFTGGGLNPGIIGEFYLNFGVFGVVFGMFLYGAALWYFWRSVRAQRAELRLAAYCMIFFYLLLSVSPGISTSLVSLFWYGLNLAFVGVILKMKLL